MTSPSVVPDQAVQALFAERTKYEGWISGLEMKRALTPTHIYERVHADYIARLQRVIEQLHSHRAALQDMANALTDRLTEIDIEEAKNRDERAEADLRAAVGEYTPEQVTQAQKRADEAIAALGLQRTSVEVEVSKLRTVLDAATPAPAAMRLETPDTGVPAQGSQSQQYESLAPTPQEQFDDLEFLKQVVDSPSGEQEAVPSAVGGPGTPSGGTEAQPAMMSAERSVAAFTESPTPSRAESRPTPSEPRLSSSFLKDVPPEQVKSLKCQECGTLNYPTEWYCERCGAELAAL
ncbi:MAG: hypothetical protein M3081_18350 [Gemmatimonadota bacterium]|nr:hypothetical protein [Gemmatimonadota bacterium]